MTRKNNFVFTILALLLVYGLTELTCFAGLQVFKKMFPTYYGYMAPFRLSRESKESLRTIVRGEFRYVRPDPDLGWTILPNGRSQDGLYRANGQGLRADKEYSEEAPSNRTRVSLFGDSFTHGDESERRDTWAARLESRSDRFEALNFGVGGYGLDQAFLRYQKEGKRYHPRIVLIGFMSENIRRHVNTFRPFYDQTGGAVMAKPRFSFNDGQWRLLPCALREAGDYRALLDDEKGALERLGRDDYYFQRYHRHAWMSATPLLQVLKFSWNMLQDKMPGPLPIIRGHYAAYNADSEAYRITLHLMELFYTEVKADGSRPVIVLFPNLRDVENIRRGKPPVYQRLLDDLRAKGYDTVDVLDAFRIAGDRPLSELYGPGRHFTALGNRIAGDHIYDFLEKGDTHG